MQKAKGRKGAAQAELLQPFQRRLQASRSRRQVEEEREHTAEAGASEYEEQGGADEADEFGEECEYGEEAEEGDESREGSSEQVSQPCCALPHWSAVLRSRSWHTELGNQQIRKRGNPS